MEPGHEDREYLGRWAPVVGTLWASMEPGHEDREYGAYNGNSHSTRPASMEPGHEDREYCAASVIAETRMRGLNGARS